MLVPALVVGSLWVIYLCWHPSPVGTSIFPPCRLHTVGFSLSLSVEDPQGQHRFDDTLGGLAAVSIELNLWSRFFTIKNTKRPHQREKTHGVKSVGSRLKLP